MSIQARFFVICCSVVLAVLGLPGAASSGAGQPLASDQLKKEHEVTLMVVQAAREEAAEIRRTGSVDAERVGRIRDFFHNFTDRCHHAKEERFFFPAALVYDDVPVREQIEDVLAEHDHARAMLQEIGYLAKRHRDPLLVADRLARYAELIMEHIARENRLIFDRSDLVLPPDEQQALLVAFRMIEEVELGEGFHEKYHALARELVGEGQGSH